jgi:hypothetical protein
MTWCGAKADESNSGSSRRRTLQARAKKARCVLTKAAMKTEERGSLGQLHWFLCRSPL